MKVCKECKKKLSDNAFFVERKSSGRIKSTGNYCCDCYKKRDNEMRKLRKARADSRKSDTGTNDVRTNIVEENTTKKTTKTVEMNNVDTIPFVLDNSKKMTKSNLININANDVNNTFAIMNVMNDINTFCEEVGNDVLRISETDVFTKYNVVYYNALLSKISNVYGILQKIALSATDNYRKNIDKLMKTYGCISCCKFNFVMDFCPDGWYNIIDNLCKDLIQIAQADEYYGCEINIILINGNKYTNNISMDIVVCRCTNTKMVDRMHSAIQSTMLTCPYCGNELHSKDNICHDCKEILNMFRIHYDMKP